MEMLIVRHVARFWRFSISTLDEGVRHGATVSPKEAGSLSSGKLLRHYLGPLFFNPGPAFARLGSALNQS